MFEFKEVHDTFEKLSTAERGQLLAEKSKAVLNGLQSLSVSELDPKEILAGFIIGSVTVDGKINEMEYLLIYPALVRTFGDDFDFRSIKEAFRHNKDGKKIVAEYTEKMLSILRFSDENLKWNVVTLCLCAASIDGKIALKEKRYIRHLCEML